MISIVTSTMGIRNVTDVHRFQYGFSSTSHVRSSKTDLWKCLIVIRDIFSAMNAIDYCGVIQLVALFKRLKIVVKK